MMIEVPLLERKAREIRGKLVEVSNLRHVPHLGSCLSCVDILVALYWSALKIDPLSPYVKGSDSFILSKGHGAPALFTTLAFKGFYPIELLNDFGQEGNPLGEHPAPNCVPGVEIATGSLGHGLSFALGKALAAKLKAESQNFFVLMGDGEINEGSVWEAAMFAPANQLNNVIAIVDFNKWQATGRSCDVMSLQSVAAKWKAFGWDTYEVDGHDMHALCEVLKKCTQDSKRPKMIVADTIKAKGVSFMEDDNNWHYRIPSAEEVLKAKQELGLITS